MDYSYIRDTFDINSISEYILSIQVSLDGFSFVLYPAGDLQNPAYIYLNCPENKSPENLVQELSRFTEFDSKDFKEIKLVIHDKVFALVPERLFDTADINAFLSLNFPSLENRKKFSNPLPAAKAVSVFTVRQELYDLLFKKFPRAEYVHSSLPFCSHALKNSVDGCFIQVYDSTFEIAVTREQKLQFYNVFEFQDTNDIIYYTLQAYKSLGLDTGSCPLEVSGSLPENSRVFTMAAQYIRNIQFYKPGFTILPGIEELPSHPQYFLNHWEIIN